MQNFNSLGCLVLEISAFQYEACHGFCAGASVHKLFVGGVYRNEVTPCTYISFCLYLLKIRTFWVIFHWYFILSKGPQAGVFRLVDKEYTGFQSVHISVFTNDKDAYIHCRFILILAQGPEYGINVRFPPLHLVPFCRHSVREIMCRDY